MSKVSTLGVKDVSVLLFFFSNPVDITLSLPLDGLNLTLAQKRATLFSTLLLIKQVRLSIGFERR